MKIRKFFIGRIFKFNHVLLEYLAVTPTLYHLILFLEFLQLLFYVFQKIDITNEFIEATSLQTTSQINAISDNQTFVSPTNTTSLSEEDFYPKNIFTVDQYFVFINFHLYSLSGSNSSTTQSFIALYLIVTGAFYFLITFAFISAGKLHALAKNEEIKDLTRFIVKGASILMIAFITILQIPMLSIQFQGYLCLEDSDDIYILENIECGGLFNQVMIILSTVTLIIYSLFILIEQMLYTSNNFDSNIPWGSIESKLALFRVLWKLLICASFMLDKYGRVRDQMRFACFMIGIIILYLRLTVVVIYDKSIHYVSTFYDFIVTWLYLCFAFHSLFVAKVTLINLSVIGASGLFLAVLAIFLYHIKVLNLSFKLKEQSGENISASNSKEAQKIIFTLSHIAMSEDESDHIYLAAYVAGHLETCRTHECGCLDLISSIEGRLYPLSLMQQEQDGLYNFNAKRRMSTLGNHHSGVDDAEIVSQSGMSQGFPSARVKQIMSNIQEEEKSMEYKSEKDVNRQLKNPTKQLQSDNQLQTFVIRTQLSQRRPLKQEVESVSQNDTPIYKKEEDMIQENLTQYPSASFRSLGKIDTPPNFQKNKFLQAPTTIMDIAGFNNRSGDVGQNSQANIVNAYLQKQQRNGPLKEGDIDEEFLKQEAIEEEFIEKAEELMKYRFLSLLIEQVIRKFPKSVDLRLHSSNIQSNRLHNEFKAVFELMKCEQLVPSIQHKFFMFRSRVLIHKKIINKNVKGSFVSDKVDPIGIYKYEKCYQQFIKYSYFAANSALAFWRELLQKNIDSQALQERGTEISKNYDRIQDLSDQISKIAPNDIKFLLRYATFLKQIVHNEYEAQVQYEKATQVYQRLLPRNNNMRMTGMEYSGSEKLFFGENTALAVIMVGLSAEEVGNIIHANDEVRRVLGYQRKDLINMNVNIILPGPIAEGHDKFLRGFLETTKPKRLNHTLQNFAITSDGYMRPVTILLKLYPHMQDKIIIVGFLQALDKIEGLDPPRQLNAISQEDGAAKLPHHYILADSNGFITTVSEGLAQEVGLSSKYFANSAALQSQVNQRQHLHIDNFFDIPQGCTSEVQEQLMTGDGLETAINTEGMMDQVNIESISQEEGLRLISKQGIFPVHLSMKRYVFSVELQCIIDLYRVILLPKFAPSAKKQQQPLDSTTLYQNVESAYNDEKGDFKNHESQLILDKGNEYSSSHSYEIMSMSHSQSSGGSSLNRITYSNIIQEFKTALEKRETPKQLVILSRIICFIIAMTILISGIDYSQKINYANDATYLTHKLVQGQSRSIEFIQIIQNIRSFINIANGFEFDSYANVELKRINRFMYLRQLIQSQTRDLQEANDYIAQQRNTYGSEEQTQFENQQINLHRLSTYNSYTNQTMPYRQALNIFLNDILELDVTDQKFLSISDYLLKAVGNNNNTNKSQIGAPKQITLMEKELFFILSNGLRSIRQTTQEVENHLIETIAQNSADQGVSSSLAIMVIGTAVSVSSLIVIVIQIIHNEKSKHQIMAIFALFSPSQVKAVYEVCDRYIDQIDKGENIPPKERNPMFEFTQKRNRGTKQAKQGGDEYALSNNNNFEDQNNKSPNLDDSELQILKMTQQSYKSSSYKVSSREYYAKMLQNTVNSLREQVYIREEQRLAYNEDPTLYGLKNKVSINLIKKIKKSGKKDQNENDGKVSKYMNKAFGLSKTSNEINSGGPHSVQAKMKNQKKHQKRFEAANGVSNFDQTTSKLHEELKEDSQSSSSRHEGSSNDFELSSRAPMRKIKQQIETSVQESQEQETLNRKHMLSYSTKERQKKCWNQVFLNAFVVALFSAYFIYSYIFHKTELSKLLDIEQHAPLFFNRYQYLFLSYQLLRERIINDNVKYEDLGFFPSKEDQHEMFNMGVPIDEYYHQKSMEVETKISRLKITRPAGLDLLIDYSNTIDSSGYCNEIFAVFQGNKQEKITITKNAAAKLRKIRREAYQVQIDTVIAACDAASTGQLEVLVKLRNKGVDLNVGDYDNRTPLHVACSGGHYEVVKYLIDHGVNAAPVDRWGATPLNDAQPYPEIKSYLLSHGSKMGKAQPPYSSMAVQVPEDQYRLYYAAFFGNVAIMDNLRLLGWNVNGQDYDGRTALGVAASEGQLSVVKYLISKGANLAIKDARGNDPLDDARRENRSSVVDYLINEALVRNFCNQYEEGLLTKGFAPAVGIFNRKFSDISIQISSAKNYTERLALLGGSKSKNSSAKPQNITQSPTQRILQVLLSTQELYLFKVVEMQVVVLLNTYKQYATEYVSQAQVLFFIFLVLQLITLFFLRRKFIETLREDVMQSRGILNLVPEGFFKENQQEVEKVIALMKK